MTTLTRNGLEMIQGGGTAGGAQATTPNPPPPPNRNQQIRDAAQQLRDAIQRNVLQEINQARAQQAAERAQLAAERAMRAQGFTVVKTPTLPQVPTGLGPAGGPLTIQTPGGGTTIVRAGGPADNVIPPQAVDISIAFFFTVAAIIILLPLARAFARRMDRRSAPAQVPAEVSAQLDHLNRAVDAIALEVERISEGQRFTTRLLTDQRDAAQSLTTGANR